MEQSRIHFISIGGSVMHSLAIALKNKGFQVSGSDDEIYEPSRSRLEHYGLLPGELGWNEKNIHEGLDAVLVGMHAKADNPEVIKAKALGLRMYSFPEYIRHLSENKHRVVIAGSHGKTTTTAIIMHVLKYAGRKFDYLIGAPVEGFENLVQITDAPLIIIEGDEYFSSPTDKTPKFLKYEHHNAVITGIAWDHMNAFPTVEEYERQFELFADQTPKAGILIYAKNDARLSAICEKERKDVTVLPYEAHKAIVKDGKTHLKLGNQLYPIEIFGDHNLYNINAALEMLKKLGVKEETFYEAIRSFSGAKKRLQQIYHSNATRIFMDYAHAPSKVKATVKALKSQFPGYKLTACLELHTFSSLNPEFIRQYKGSMDDADDALVFVNPNNIKHKDRVQITAEDVLNAFAKDGLVFSTQQEDLKKFIKDKSKDHRNLLLMSSGNFASLDIEKLIKELQ
ncbi:MAG: peptidoglycan synthetase [Cyclobacteriaceae bacterium]|nr:peptidoglycan synthetase [Cyclobacteriaceae bacterium]